MNKLLERQIKKIFNENDLIPEKMQPLFDMISKAYDDYDKGRILTERSFDLSSKEFAVANNELKSEIRERKLAEERLMASEERSRAYLESSPVCTKIVDLDLNLQYMSRAGVEGLCIDDITKFYGKPYPFDFFPESFCNSMTNSLKKSRETGKIITQEAPVVDTEGNELWFHSTIVPIKDGEGRIDYFLVISVDTTQRKKAEEKIKEKAFLLDASSAIISTTDLEGRLTYINPIFLNSLGFDNASEVLGELFTKFWMVGGSFEDVTKELIGEGGSRKWEGELSVKRKDGSLFDAYVSVNTVLDGHGNPGAMMATTIDISKRKKEEKQNRIFSKAIANTFDGIVLTGKDGNITYANQAACEMSLFTPDEITNTNVIKEWVPDPKIAQDIIRCQMEQGKYFGEFTAMRKDKSTYDCSLTATVILSNEGELIGTIGIFRDISKNKEAEREKRNLQKQLLHSQKMDSIGTLANGIAHNFNNILGAIRGFTEMALEDVGKDSRVHKDLERAINSVDMAKQLTAQMLTFSRVHKQETKEIEIAPVVREVIELFKASTQGGVDIREKIDDNSGYVKVDPNQLQHMLLNICNNSFQAIKNSSDTIKVELKGIDADVDLAKKVESLKEGKYVKITIRDTGHGMDEETLGRIFEPFFTTKEVGKGTGLGLSMVHGIIESYDGEIVVESELGAGTTVSIYLPRVDGNI